MKMQRDTRTRKGVGKTLRDYATGLGIALGFGTGFAALHFVVAGILGKLPYEIVAVPGFLLAVAALVVFGATAERLKGSKKWLVLVAAGLVIMAGALLVVYLQGNLHAEFDVLAPRADPIRVSAGWLLWFTVPCGIVLVLTGAVGYWWGVQKSQN